MKPEPRLRKRQNAMRENRLVHKTCCAAFLLAAVLFGPGPARAAGEACGYMPDETYNRLDPAEIGCVSIWRRDNSLQEASGCVTLSVEKLDEAAETAALLVTLKNTCAEAITFHEARLPWRYGTSGLSLVMEPLDGTGRTVRARAPLASSLMHVVLGPERSASAVMRLGNYFRNLDSALRHSDIMLYWVFRFDDAAPEQEGGILFRAAEDDWMGIGPTEAPAAGEAATEAADEQTETAPEASGKVR